MKTLKKRIMSFLIWYKVSMLFLLGLMICCSNSFSKSPKPAEQNKIRLKVYFKEAKPGDTLLLYVSQRYFKSLGSADSKPQAQVINNNGAFIFEVPVKYASGYWQLRKLAYNVGKAKNNLPQLVQQHYWEVGDDVTLKVSSNLLIGTLIKSKCQFSGKGAAKYNLRNKADSIFWNSIDFVKANRDPNEKFGAININMMKLLSQYVDNDKNTSPIAKYLIKTDLFMNEGRGMSIIFERYVERMKISLGSPERDSLINLAVFLYNGSGILPIDQNKIHLSGIALNFLWYGLKLESTLRFARADTKWIYDQINKRYESVLRDQLLAYWFQFQRIEGGIAGELYKDAISICKSEDALAQLKSVEHFYLKKYLKNYSLTNAQGKIVNFNQFKNKIMFIDFWFTGCAACASLYKNVVSKVEEKFANDTSVVFVTVSADKSKEKWFGGLKSGMYTSDLAINLYTGGEGFMHPIIWDNKLSYMPVGMLVDAEGVIRYFNTDNLYKEKDLIKAIEELKKE